MTRYLRAANVKDGSLDLGDVKEMNFTPREREVFSLRPGDVLVSEGAGSLSAVGAAAVWNGELPGPICFQNTLLRLRPRRSTDARFLSWWCRYAYSSGLFASVASGANIFHLSVERVRGIPAWVPDTSEQTLISDFLDAETARIDALIEKKWRMIQLVDERARTIADRVLWSNLRPEIPLMRCVQQQRPVMYGIVLPGPDVGAGGVPIVKGGDVGAALTLDRLARTTPEVERPYARARLQPGDLLFAIRGGVGDAAIVPAELEDANITQDVARVAPTAEVISEWLLHVLRSRTFQLRAKELIRGATITGLNIRDLERIRIPWANRSRQEAELLALRPLAARSEGLSRRLERQITLLREHRQALIAAAVTGQLEIVSRASTRSRSSARSP